MTEMRRSPSYVQSSRNRDNAVVGDIRPGCVQDLLGEGGGDKTSLIFALFDFSEVIAQGTDLILHQPECLKERIVFMLHRLSHSQYASSLMARVQATYFWLRVTPWVRTIAEGYSIPLAAWIE